MNNCIILEKFNKIYHDTYKNTLKYILIHCNNLDDVKDLVQETYLDFYKYLLRNDLNKIDDIDRYIIGISKNILNKYYHSKYKDYNVVSIYQDEEDEKIMNSDVNLELQFITKENVQEVWKYIKNKDIKIAKIFYCYYHLDMKIIEIAVEMQIKESTVKNYIYRTIRELQQIFKMEDYENEKT